jgi:hypothetical protein
MPDSIKGTAEEMELVQTVVGTQFLTSLMPDGARSTLRVLEEGTVKS